MSDTYIVRVPLTQKIVVKDLPAPGPQGLKGDAATISVGTVVTGAPQSLVSVVNSGNSSNAVFNFSIPQGVKGDSVTNIDGGRADSIYGGLPPLDGGTP
jgi:hypothetical protein